MSESRYLLRPRADRDLDDQAYVADPELGHRFLPATHDTFTLLASQPNIGWHPRLRHPGLETMRVFRITGFEKILVLSICRSSMVLKSSGSSTVHAIWKPFFAEKGLSSPRVPGSLKPMFLGESITPGEK